ncbi:MAG: radical SAM protein [Candidatus Helarchaeota archaeon]
MHHLNLCITNRCNQDCIHCYVNPNNPPFEELSQDYIVETINKASSHGLKSIHIFGGEPFLRKDLKNICNQLNQLGISISIATNGHFLNPSDFDWIKDYNIFLTVSINGPKEIHDKFANMPGSYEIVLKTVKNLVNTKIKFAITTCINKININYYKELIFNLSNLGISNYLILYFSPIGRGMDLIDYIVSNKEWESFVLDLQKFAHNLEHEIEISFEPSIFNRKNITYFTFQQGWNSCFIQSKEMFVLDANGDVYPCILLIRDKRFLLGNIKNIDLIDIYKKDLTTILREVLKIPSICIECDLLNLCKSGCIAYKGRNNLDFRCNPNKKNYALFCPLFTKILY